MGTQERPPRGRPLATRLEPLHFEDGRNRRSRDAMAHVLQRTLDARRAPCRILPRHPNHQAPDFGEHPRAACAAPGISPLPRNQLTMPSKDGVRRDKRRHVSQHGASESLTQDRESATLRIGQSQPAPSQLCFERPILFAKEGVTSCCSRSSHPSSAARKIWNGTTG